MGEFKRRGVDLDNNACRIRVMAKLGPAKAAAARITWGQFVAEGKPDENTRRIAEKA